MNRYHLLLFLPLLAVPQAKAVISYTSPLSVVSQNFDSLASSGTSNAWTNDSTLPGWSLFIASGAAAPNYDAGTGSSNSGKFYSFGSSGNSDRALGGLGSGGAYYGSPANGAVAGYISVSLTNATGSTLESFSISYAGEQWRDGGAATPSAQTMRGQWGLGATFADVAAWTPFPTSADFVSPVFANTGSGAAVDGNGVGRTAALGATVNATWAPGETLWIRWIENNDIGNDHALAIDDFSFSASAVPVPEPATGLLTALCGGLLLRRRRS